MNKWRKTVHVLCPICGQMHDAKKAQHLYQALSHSLGYITKIEFTTTFRTHYIEKHYDEEYRLVCFVMETLGDDEIPF